MMPGLVILQHRGNIWDMARMRAVENNVWLLRSANTGVSALIDPCGRVVAQSRLFEPALVEGTAYFQQGGSLYTRTGDSLPAFTRHYRVGVVVGSRVKKSCDSPVKASNLASYCIGASCVKRAQ